MGQQVPWGERLLDHRQAELVQRLELVGLFFGVDAVGIDMEIQVRVGGADGADWFDVPAGAILSFTRG